MKFLDKIKKVFLFFFVLCCCSVLYTKPAVAQPFVPNCLNCSNYNYCQTNHAFCANTCQTVCSDKSVKELGFFKGLGPLSDFINSLGPDNPAPATSMLTKLISIGIGIFTIIAFLWFIYVLFSGTLSWLTSGGDKAKLQEAQKRITSGLIGLILTFSAIFIIKIIGTILGFDILDLTTIVGGLWK